MVELTLMYFNVDKFTDLSATVELIFKTIISKPKLETILSKPHKSQRKRQKKH